MSDDRLSLRIANDIAEIAPLTETVDAFCTEQGVTVADIFKVSLALEELLSNTISYGYADDGRHEIALEVARRGEDLVIEIADDAKPFDPLQAPPPALDLSIEERPIGGLGVYLVKTLMDAVEYRREGDRNHLTLRKRIGSDAG